MKVLIIVGKNKEGQKEAIEEDILSWREGIDRSPKDEFVVIDNFFDYLFFEKLPGILSCGITSKRNGAFVDSYDGSDAVSEFDRLLHVIG